MSCPACERHPHLRQLVIDLALSARTVEDCAEAAHVLGEYVTVTGDDSVLYAGEQLVMMAEALHHIGRQSPATH